MINKLQIKERKYQRTNTVQQIVQQSSMILKINCNISYERNINLKEVKLMYTSTRKRFDSLLFLFCDILLQMVGLITSIQQQAQFPKFSNILSTVCSHKYSCCAVMQECVCRQKQLIRMRKRGLLCRMQLIVRLLYELTK